MNAHSTKTMLLTMFIAFLILSGFLYFYVQNMDEKRGITAMEVKAIADSVALNWSENATLVYVHGTRDSQDNGRYMAWGFSYAMSVDSNISMRIHVFSNGSTYEELGTHYSFEYAIYNWTIDSDEAYSIAMKNEKIKAFMDRYDNAHVDGFYLTMPSENSSHPVWNIYFMAGAVDLSPHNANITIDATTGEVIYVEASLTSHSWTNDMCCISSLIAPVLIVSAAVLIIRKRGRKEQEKRRLEEEKINTEYELRKWDEEHGKRG